MEAIGEVEGVDLLRRWTGQGGTVREAVRRGGVVRLDLMTCDGGEVMEVVVLAADVWDSWRRSQT